jgi:hypothetical protein
MRLHIGTLVVMTQLCSAGLAGLDINTIATPAAFFISSSIAFICASDAAFLFIHD